jgi:S-adenosylmethionine:tRNA ribosyltransferase-isomerase
MEILDKYDYTLPPRLIAQTPAEPRDSARLFVYDTRTDTVIFSTFRQLADFLPPRAVMIMNDTRVVPARVSFQKETGGKIEGLLLINEGFTKEGEIRAIAVKALPVGKKIFLGDEAMAVSRQEGQIFFLKPEFPKEELVPLLEKIGTTPIPPYISKHALTEAELRKRYQTVFAKQGASVAAPTASLHFTETVFSSLDEKNIDRLPVTLDVGMGTFAPVTEQHVREKKLHTEKIAIPSATRERIKESKNAGLPIIAVGTTVVRTLESGAGAILAQNSSLKGDTDLFIMPPYDFKIVDMLITNFHVPKSSLLCLVDAFLEHKQAKKTVLDLYEIAVSEKFRFFSFGDAMLIV